MTEPTPRPNQQKIAAFLGSEIVGEVSVPPFGIPPSEPTPDLQRALEELERPFGVTPATELVRSTLAALLADREVMHKAGQKLTAEVDEIAAAYKSVAKLNDALTAENAELRAELDKARAEACYDDCLYITRHKPELATVIAERDAARAALERRPPMPDVTPGIPGT